MDSIEHTDPNTVPLHVAALVDKEFDGAGSSEAEMSPFILVDFDGDHDPSNPINWKRSYKWTVVGILSAMSLITNIGTVMCSPVAPQILEEFGIGGDYVYSTLIVSIWELGEALGPLLTAPLSELLGRRPVYNIANLLFVVFAICCATSSNIHALVAFRFLNGLVVAAITLNPGIVGDMFRQEERGRAMSIMNLPPLLGPTLGPIFSAYLTQAKGWRWTFWLTAIVASAGALALLVVFQESYKVQILRDKARRLQKQQQQQSVHRRIKLPAQYETKGGGGAASFWKESSLRPLQLLVQSPIVLLLGLYVAVVYGYLFVVLTYLPEVFQSPLYGFSQGASGLTFLGPGLGMLAGVTLNFFTSDWYVKLRAARSGASMKPEHRLPPMILGGFIIPAGFFVYGWTAQAQVQWMAPIMGTALIGFGLLVTNVPCFSYLVDAFGVHAASAMAAVTVIKCLFGALLPLAAPPLYEKLGLGWGNSLFGFIALLFLPVPLLFMRYGESIRASSKFQAVF